MQREALKLVFSNRKYLALTVSIFVGLLTVHFIIYEFTFLYTGDEFVESANESVNFALIVIVAALSGIVISLSTYRIRLMKSGIRKNGTGFLGSMIGASAGACSVGSVSSVVISTFGTVGGTAIAFLSIYEIPLRLISIAILGYMYYVSVKGIIGHLKLQSELL